MNSTRASAAFDDLQLRLGSLAESGDIDYGGGITDKIEPLPKAIRTLEEYRTDERRHADMLRVSHAQLVLGLGMMLLAGVTLFVQLLDLIGTGAAE